MASFKAFTDKHNVAHKLYKSSLLNTVCLVAGLSIFFFGYDQGLMGGVNTTRNYAEIMGFGHWDEELGIVVVDKPLLQGGIVSTCFPVIGLWLISLGCGLLPTRHSCRLSARWMDG